MLYAMLAACAALIFVLVLAVPHAAKAHHRARLFGAAGRGRADGPPRRGKRERRCGVHV